VSDVRPEEPTEPTGAAELPAKPVLTAKQANRAKAPVVGMLLAVGLTLAVLLPVMFLNPGSKPEVYKRNIDVPGVALQAKSTAGYLPLAVDLPAGWSSNYARWNTGGTAGVPAWEVGYLTPGHEYIGLVQTDKANPTWISQATDNAPVTGDRKAGASWELRDSGKGERSLVLEHGDVTVILSGTAELDEFDVLATAVVKELDRK
jgi:hypothetical protein